MNLLHDRLHSLLKGFVKNGPAGCSLQVMHNNETVFREFIGFADIETETIVKEDTIFRIYSMTKVVTCVAALMLYERGLFLLNDQLSDYLPEFKDSIVYATNENGNVKVVTASRPILVKDLFTMTSGITYGGNENETQIQVVKEFEKLVKSRESLTNRRLSEILASIPLAFHPGEQWHYGLSHDVLGTLIEVISGKKLGEFFQEEIFSPLGMDDTFFRIPDEKLHRLASLYNREEDGTLIKNKNEQMDMQFHIFPEYESGGAGLLSTLKDYSRFAHMLANGGKFHGKRIIGENTIKLMTTNHLIKQQTPYYNWDYLKGYGYGLGVRTLIDKAEGGINSSIGEFGWSGLAGTWVLIDPKEKISAVYMQQMLPNFEAFHQPRLRSVIYGALK
ncbi:CubicO group peptidase (beta-lactamase class C family) [Metabacillus crassostreae]|uniref:serine hydrolase domain-containing protein n=1 Tax=Metabacillus crassostreae TaxID=929098 RepID=UPI001EF95F1A|nr:serine hydrolase domain-containing protein [Metabacillus crassostreae]MBM7602918.1 CubicO group peptidase (beta-lactamase class C family) [Metabacillus crassostreae]